MGETPRLQAKPLGGPQGRSVLGNMREATSTRRRGLRGIQLPERAVFADLSRPARPRTLAFRRGSGAQNSPALSQQMKRVALEPCNLNVIEIHGAAPRPIGGHLQREVIGQVTALEGLREWEPRPGRDGPAACLRLNNVLGICGAIRARPGIRCEHCTPGMYRHQSTHTP